jgi:hypothetical protein
VKAGVVKDAGFFYASIDRPLIGQIKLIGADLRLSAQSAKSAAYCRAC